MRARPSCACGEIAMGESLDLTALRRALASLEDSLEARNA